MLHLHPIDAASAATSQLDRNRRQFRTANTFHAGWSRPAVPASVSRFSSCCRAPRRLRAEGTTRSLRCGGAEDGHPSQDSSTASPSRPGRTPPLGDPATPSSGGVLDENLTCHNRLKAPPSPGLWAHGASCCTRASPSTIATRGGTVYNENHAPEADTSPPTTHTQVDATQPSPSSPEAAQGQFRPALTPSSPQDAPTPSSNMAEPDDANNNKLDKNLLKAIQAITSFDPTGSPSANRKSLEDKLLKLAATLQMFQFTRVIRICW